MTAQSPVLELTAVFARIQGMLLSREAAAEAVHQLAQVARDLITSAVGAGVSVLDPAGTRISTGATDPVVETADAAQYELGEGPCLSAWATSAPQRLDDTATDTRWPGWSAAVQPLGVRSVLSAPMVFRGETMGAMKVYATTAGAFTEADETMLGLLAAAAATLIGAGQSPEAPHRLSAALQETLTDRQTIDVATGVLMERRRLPQGEARRLMLDTARTGHQSLLEIARHLLDRATDPAP